MSKVGRSRDLRHGGRLQTLQVHPGPPQVFLIIWLAGRRVWAGPPAGDRHLLSNIKRSFNSFTLFEFHHIFLSASLCLVVNNSGHVSTFNWGLRPSSSSSSSEDKTLTWSRALFIFHLILIWKPWSWIKAVEFNPEGSEEPLLFDSIIIWADYQRILDFDLLIEFKSVHSFHFICVDELKCQRIKIFNEIWSNKNLIYGGIKIIKIAKTFVCLWINRSD